MDPSKLPPPPLFSWFPRPRGDGPHVHQVDASACLVSPPTRGWTVLTGDVASPLLGFPAHAGMDLLALCSALTATWFPPPTRGWTSAIALPWIWTGGFPAHAGMDLRYSAA